MNVNFLTPVELRLVIAKKAKKKRLSNNMSQISLSERSGVSLSVLKKFESSGKISLESLLKLAFVLESLNDFETIFASKNAESFLTLDELLNQKDRKRGRK